MNLCRNLVHCRPTGREGRGGQRLGWLFHVLSPSAAASCCWVTGYKPYHVCDKLMRALCEFIYQSFFCLLHSQGMCRQSISTRVLAGKLIRTPSTFEMRGEMEAKGHPAVGSDGSGKSHSDARQCQGKPTLLPHVAHEKNVA